MGEKAKKILIVDDDFSSRRLISSTILKKWPAKVLHAEEGSEALRMTLQERPHVVILDMQMPFMDGIEFLTIMRNTQAISDIPVIACSAIDDKENINRILAFVVDDYIVKPIDRKVLIKKLSAFITKK